MDPLLKKEILNNLEKAIEIGENGDVIYKKGCDTYFIKIVNLKLRHNILISDLKEIIKESLENGKCKERTVDDVWVDMLEA